MFFSSNKTEYLSGYLKINENLQIEEFSGQINQILRHENLDLDVNFSQIIEDLKKNISNFFKNEVIPAIRENKIRHLFFERKKSILSIAITPLCSGLTLLSFEETNQPKKQIEQTLPEITEEKLSESEQRYQMAIEAADLGIWDFEVNSNKTFYSNRWKSLLGYYPDELTDKYSEWEELLHPEDKDRMTRFMSTFLNSDLRVYEAEFRMKHKNGHFIWIKSRAIALRDENGKATRILGTHRDITEEKKSENEFKKLHQAILQSPIAVVITDHLGYIEFCNPAFCKITGWNDQEIIGKKPSVLKSGFQPVSHYEKLWRTISSGNEWQGEFKNKKKNGEFYWELASISPIRNSFGTITHYVKIAENITYLKKIEKDLKKAKHEAEIANNYKNHFLANMSHEIRTPINTIIGFSELIKNEGLLPQKRNKYSEIIEENSQSLLRLIDDIIDVSKIEANELKIKKEACPLGELFSELEMTYGNFLKRKQKRSIELVFQIAKEPHHDVIFTDPYRLRQILNNLFLNALKHTEIGKIEVGYNIVNDTKLRFFVSDTGAGIPPDRLSNIFKRFNYNDDSPIADSGASV
jgi:PAS domain S-box-containing protein